MVELIPANAILKDVSLEDFMWPCYAYCKARTGCTLPYGEFIKLQESPVPSTDDIPLGTILRWDSNNGDNNYIEQFLTVENGRVISTWVNNDKHYAVYEGDGVVSDLVVDKDAYIRMRKLKDLYRKPLGAIFPYAWSGAVVMPEADEVDSLLRSGPVDEIIWKSEGYDETGTEIVPWIAEQIKPCYKCGTEKTPHHAYLMQDDKPYDTLICRECGQNVLGPCMLDCVKQWNKMYEATK